MARKPKTAAELIEELARSSEYQQKMKEIDVRRQELRREQQEDQRTLIADCENVGVIIDSVWDLVNSSNSYAPAIPVLVKHLDQHHTPRTIEGIVRALTTRESKGIAFCALAKLFRETEDGDSELKWLIGDAIAESATEEHFDAIVELADDARHGRGREFLPLALVYSDKTRALPILEKWTSDPVLAASATRALRILNRSDRSKG